MSEIWNRFKRSWNDGKEGFGRHSYAAARAAGFSNAEISAQVGGYRVGRRAKDMIGAGIQAERRSSAAADRARNEAAQYKSQLDSYKNQLNSYQSQVSSLTSQYQSQLQATQAAQKSADEFQSKFQKASTDYELAKQEADTYREQAVGQQLRAIRSGATATGGNERVGGVGGLTGGRQAFSGSDEKESDITKAAKAEGGLTDSVLSNKGPVVERMNTADQRQTASRRAPNSGLARGAGTSSYYASRFN